MPFKEIYKITGIAVYFFSLQGLLFRVGITSKG